MGLKGLCICVRISSVFKRKADEWHKRMMCSLGYFIQSAVHTYKIKIMSLQFYQLLSFFKNILCNSTEEMIVEVSQALLLYF